MNETNNEGVKVYEIGYHIVPSIPQEKVAGEVEILKSLLAKHGASLIAEEAPKLRQLAYKMDKKIGAVRHKFTDAYFGWVKFEINSEALKDIKAALDLNEHILRYLLIITVKESTLIGNKLAPKPVEEVKEVKETKEGEAPVVKKEVSEEEIEKTIDDLVIE